MGNQLCNYTWGPVDDVLESGMPVRGLSQAQIKEIVKAYGKCAVLAKRAGFRMIIIHGGHGWLIQQFLSPFHNGTEAVWKTAADLQWRSVRKSGMRWEKDFPSSFA